MMDNRIKRISAFIFCIFIIALSVASVPIFALSYGDVIDDAQIFNNQEKQDIRNAISAVSGTKIYIVTTNDNFFSENTLLSKIESDNCIALTINMNTRNYNIYTYGQANSNITDKEVRRLETAVESKLSNDDYAKAALIFIEKAGIAYNGDLRIDIGLIILVSLGISVVVAIIICSIVIAKYKMKMRPTNYPLDKYAKMQLKDKEDVFTGKFVTTRRIQTSNTSSGGSRSGGGGGGHRGGGKF